jgi:hypothetical protein
VNQLDSTAIHWKGTIRKYIRKLKSWYEKESGTKITDGKAREAMPNLREFIETLAEWKARAGQRK